MTTIAMMTLTQVGATLLAIITAVILAATALVVATPPDSTHGRRCFRAIMAAGSADLILAAVESFFKVRGRADLGVRGNDVLNQAVGEIILFGICTHVLERLTGQGGYKLGRDNILPPIQHVRRAHPPSLHALLAAARLLAAIIVCARTHIARSCCPRI
jgi:hypothetical protein